MFSLGEIVNGFPLFVLNPNMRGTVACAEAARRVNASLQDQTLAHVLTDDKEHLPDLVGALSAQALTGFQSQACYRQVEQQPSLALLRRCPAATPGLDSRFPCPAVNPALVPER